VLDHVRSCTSERSATSTIRLSCDSSWEWRGPREHFPRPHLQRRGPRAIYFLAASGLSLIYGLMDVLNFAHGLFMTLAPTRDTRSRRGSDIAGAPTLVILAIIGATLFGGLAAGVTELILIRPLYGKPISQILITIGLDLAVVGLLMGASAVPRCRSLCRSG